MDRLVLFDIDGTLLSTGGAGGRALRLALFDVFGTAGPIESHSFAGKTDPQIAMELLHAAGLTAAEIEAGLHRLWESYLGYLPDELDRATIQVFPGVTELLNRLESDAVPVEMGLLTGNLARGARLKLESARLGADRFVVGAFGSDHARRDALPAIAVERARALSGRNFAGKEIVVIGDTPYDIACGASLGVRTVAVATGTFSAEQLARCEPDHLFDSLADTEQVYESIVGE
jgi:phosphoglycolate phosphatase